MSYFFLLTFVIFVFYDVRFFSFRAHQALFLYKTIELLLNVSHSQGYNYLIHFSIFLVVLEKEFRRYCDNDDDDDDDDDDDNDDSANDEVF